jgi:hypothetical protein
MIRRRNSADLDETLFYEYISGVLISYVSSLPSRPELADQSAILLMDSGLPHMSQCILRIFDENNIIALTFLTHTTNLFQTLDFVLFDSLEHLKATTVGEFGDDSVNNHLINLIQAHEQISASRTIMRSFRRAGMTQDATTRPYRIMVDEVTMRESPGFQVIWERNVSIDDLLRRRRMK